MPASSQNAMLLKFLKGVEENDESHDHGFPLSPINTIPWGGSHKVDIYSFQVCINIREFSGPREDAKERLQVRIQ